MKLCANSLAPPERGRKLTCMDRDQLDYPTRKLCGSCSTRRDRESRKRGVVILLSRELASCGPPLLRGAVLLC